MRGWVYIITNKAMPGLVKVGYTRKDPEYRAKELNSTGNPHPYIVAYEALVDLPHDVERRTHIALAKFREGKEWFNCEISDAVVEIRNASNYELYVENLKAGVGEDKVAVTTKQRTKNQEIIRAKELHVQRVKEWRSNVKEQLSLQEEISRKKMIGLIERIEKTPFWVAWAGTSVAIVVLFALFDTEVDEGIWIISGLFGAVGALWVQPFLDKENGATSQEEYFRHAHRKEVEDLKSKYPFSVDEIRLGFTAKSTAGITGNAKVVTKDGNYFVEGIIQNKTQSELRSLDIEFDCKESQALETKRLDIYLNASAEVPFMLPISTRPKSLVWSIKAVYA